MTPASLRPPRVVVAEHESIIRMDIAEIFAAAGYLVVAQARSANEAVVLTLFLQPDLLVFDQSLAPESRADDLVLRLRRTEFRCAVVETTCSPPQPARRGKAAGDLSVRPVTYLAKPFTSDDLLNAAARALSDLEATPRNAGSIPASRPVRKVRTAESRMR